ncbi:hypothetical protein [Streptomyces sp. NPDC088736]
MCPAVRVPGELALDVESFGWTGSDGALRPDALTGRSSGAGA